MRLNILLTKMRSLGSGLDQVLLIKRMASNFTNRLVFRQLFDHQSSTYTYLLGDSEIGEAVLIDPVFEQAERDKKLVEDLGLKLKFVMNTHVHADHVTGTGLLKQILGPSVKSVLSTASGGDADVKLEHGDNVGFGKYTLEARGTPGHTNGCMSFVFHEGRMVFTGDAVLIRGCGRTDFQEGNAETLYNSVQSQIFTLQDDYLIYPAHDYKGLMCSSVGEEKKYNPRLTKDMETFKSIMDGLGLPYPKQIDIAVPANKVCGLYNLPPHMEEKLAMAKE